MLKREKNICKREEEIITDTPVRKSIEEVAQEWLNKIILRLKQSSYDRYYGITHNHIIPTVTS